MFNLKVKDKEYKIEFSFEAAYNGSCVENTIEMISYSDEDEETTIEKIAKLPKLVTSIFADGLIEHQPDLVESDAKQILKDYFAENKGKENFMTLMSKIAECMGDDGFLALIGLADNQEEEKVVKMPQDHKKKATKVTEK